MNLPIEPPLKTSLPPSESKSNSVSSTSAIISNKWIRQLEKRLWRAIDFLHIITMFFSLYTGLIVAILRNELFEQCPLYAKLKLRDNATQFTTETIDRETQWGSVYTCEFASFAYLSAFVVSFITLWIHIVFRRVLRTERLLRLPIGLLILIFALISLVATSLVTDGVIKFCLRSSGNLCSSSGPAIFSQARWKIISLPVGGWLTTLSILLNTIARGIQLFSKPKKSPETLKVLLNQLMTTRHQNKREKENSEFASPISREKNPSQSLRQYSTDQNSNREFNSKLYPYYYPPIPQYRQIEKRSRFRRICCPCFRRRRRRRRQRSFNKSYQPFIIPNEYYNRLNHLKQNGTVPMNVCHHHHSTHQPTEQQTQTNLTPQRKNLDEKNEIPLLGRRRSSVRFEDETSLIKKSDQSSLSSKTEPIPIIKKEEKEEKKEASPILENDNLQRNVSFRNNEDDLWTTITINTDQSTPIQSSHYNRLTLENLSCIDTSITNTDNGVTAIHVNSKPIESVSLDGVEKEIPSPPLPPPPFKTTRHRPTTNHHKLPPPPPSRSHTTSSEDDIDLRHIKPVEEINTIVADKYNYNDLSQALKSNVERLKNTFIHAQKNQSSSDKSMNTRSILSSNHSSDC